MAVTNSAGAAMAASASENARPLTMRPRPIPAAGLRARLVDGSYPFRGHATVADLWSAAA